jgi:ribonuclease HI
MRLDPDQGVLVFTDGSAATSDRSGGWAYVALDAYSGLAEDSGGVTDTTISRMELQAPTEALEMLAREYGACEVLIKSDSQYVVRGFMDKSRARRANVDMWDRLEAAAALHTYVEMAHVRGHKGHVWNERADVLAGQARRSVVRDLAAGQAAAREAIDRVLQNADAEWIDAALAAVAVTAQDQPLLTTDDIWDLVDDAHENRAMGAVMTKARNLGWIKSSSETVKSERPQCHARDIRVWVSNLCPA